MRGVNGQNKQKCLSELELKPFNPETFKAQHEAEVLKSFEAFLDLEKLQDKNLEFLFEGFLPFEYLLVLTAEAGEGKTTLAYGLAKTAIKKGIKVVYLDADNSLPFIKQNLENFGLIEELKERLFILSRQLVDLSINKDDPYWKAVKRLLKSVRRCLVIVDTLGAFTRGYDPNSDKDMREVMSELKEIRDMGHAVLVLHHIQKYASIDGKLPPELRYRGSGVVKADADALFYMQREGNVYILQAGKMRFMGFPIIKITLLEDKTIKKELHTPESKEKREARMLLDLMEEGREYTRQDIMSLAKNWYNWGRDKTLKLLNLLQDKRLLKVQKGQKSKGKGYIYIKFSGQVDATDDLLTDF